MNTTPPPEPLSSANRLQGRAACSDALRAALLALAPSAATAAVPEAPALAQQVWCVDHHFAAWPLEDAAVQRALAAWLHRPGRRLRLIGLDFETTMKCLPRFVRWRRDHAHRIDVWRPSDAQLPPGLRGLLVGATLWQWQGAKDQQLLRITNPVYLAVFKAEIADFLQRCEPAWPVSILGL